ncbi:hypothetical protein AALP_AA7G214000 [Arabis alpina]|uniref:TF-B3 domain-containing protein n=1 Tax=Arabis alpina TaxID=50452 RepID=A0A087GJM8_ARAAL|nr:hypothetical protein AALP_AA7G214000 [Arabis alpina]
MLIPISYYDELPSRLPKTVILQGASGGIWNVKLKYEQDEVYFGQGWSKFVRDNSLTDGEFLTFAYNGDRIFEVSIYRLDACKEIGAVSEVDDDKEDSVCLTTSDDSESETILRSKNKGKSKVEVVKDSDEEEDSVYALSDEEDTETDTCSEVKIVNNIQRSKNKGKEIVKSSDEDSDSDYIEAFGSLDLEENSYSENSYSSDSEYEAATYAKPKAKNLKKKGKSKSNDDENATSSLVQKRTKVKAKIKNPEKYLDDPKNIHFETGVKNRTYELYILRQLVKDYNLMFPNHIKYIDDIGSFEVRAIQWSDLRVCIKDWNVICERNNVKKEDRILCELFRKKNLVYAVKIHIIRGKDL